MKTHTVCFTANYSRTTSNFAIQNLPPVPATRANTYQSAFAVLKNILQRGAIAELSGGHIGAPSRLSTYLADENRIGERLKTTTDQPDISPSLFLISLKPGVWHRTIKGGTNRAGNTINPARDFFDALPALLGEYGFVQQLIRPETLVSDIHPDHKQQFISQQVDFYCPPAKLIIEIDGGYHLDGIVRLKDENRDTFFASIGILTVRIETKDWYEKTPFFDEAIAQINNRLIEKEQKLLPYKSLHQRLTKTGFTQDEIHYKLLPTAVIRFQLLVLELLISHRITLADERWHFVVQDSDGLSQQSDRYARFASMAIGDLFAWLAPLCKLMSLPFTQQPAVVPIIPATKVVYQPGAIHVNFSLLQRYTDEHLAQPETIFVRTDYFVANQECDGKNYFRVATTAPVNYNLTPTDETAEILRFFLKNIFGKDVFRDGQLPIILNVLNRRDTIGLLPTGGGKSICYQLPCLLQPAVSVVVCPIKSLMYDQKDNLDKASITRTNYITGELEADVKETIQREFAEKHYFFVWISPERFQVKTFRAYLTNLYAKTPLAYVVIDEVHCMSEWGHDFRTSYLNLTRTIHELCPSTTLVGLTATASLNVLRNLRIEFARSEAVFADEDVKTKLDFARPELHFEVIDDAGKKADTLKVMLTDLSIKLMDANSNRAGLIFTPFVNSDFGCWKVSNKINTQFPGRANWFAGKCPTKNEYVSIPKSAFNDRDLFTASLTAVIGNRLDAFAIERAFSNRNTYLLLGDKFPKEGFKKIILKKVPILTNDEFETHKREVQKGYKANKFPLMVATKAFGMGIDKQNIYYTFHYGIPGSTESLYQEAGRAGRWADKTKQAVCRVLFTPETLEEATMNALFAPKTPLAKLKELTTLVDGAGHPLPEGDMLRQFFLFKMGLGEVEEELAVMLKLRDYVLTEPKAPTVNVLWDGPSGEFKKASESGEEFFKQLGSMSTDNRKAVTEKALYRLSILGIVEDWTTDFVCHFAVRFRVLPDEAVLRNLLTHVVKYRRDDADDTTNLEKQIRQLPGDTLWEQCGRFLLQWTWETITFNRRESLKNLYDLCLNFKSSESFKRSLENYFRVDELTIILQYIADNPKQFAEWPKAFQYKAEQNADLTFVQDKSILNARAEALSRILESTNENLAIDTVSGLLQLAKATYDVPQGRARLENTLSRMKNYFSVEEQLAVLQTIVAIGAGINLPETSRYDLAESIERFYPGSYNWVSGELGIIHIPQLTATNQRLRTLNQKLYERFSKKIK